MVDLLKKLLSSINFRTISQFLLINEAIAFLKVDRSMNHKKDDLVAFMDADREAEYKRANSPNPYPDYIFLFATPLISTVSSPSCRIKKELAWSFCLIRYSPLFTLQSINFSNSSSCISLSWIKVENVKWELRLFRMSARSMTLFFLSRTWKFS